MRIIGGSQRGRRLFPPKDRSIRPALDRIRESIFNVLGDRVERARVLDLFAGVGAFGLESLSRGARRAHFVDASKGSIAILKKNVAQLGFEAFADVDCADAFSTPLVDPEAPLLYDIVFLDPPFPLFKEPASVETIFRRVAELVESGRARESGAESQIVLRQPSWYREAPPVEPEDRRAYGESVVLFY